MSKLSLDISEGSLVKQNIQTDLILISEDKVEIILMKHKKAVNGISSWLAPLSLALSFGATLLTADFKDVLYLTGEKWQLVFTILLIISILWLLVSIVQAIMYAGKTSVKYIIKMMNEGKENK